MSALLPILLGASISVYAYDRWLGASLMKDVHALRKGATARTLQKRTAYKGSRKAKRAKRRLLAAYDVLTFANRHVPVGWAWARQTSWGENVSSSPLQEIAYISGVTERMKRMIGPRTQP